jgi:hypothetical protein
VLSSVVEAEREREDFMPKTCRLWIRIYFTAFVLLSFQTASAGENLPQYKKISVGIPAFTMNPNEKIVGFKLAVANGKVDFSLVPKGWNCGTTGTPGLDQTMLCSSPSPSYALYNSAMLPETAIYDMSTIGGDPLNFEVTIEMEGGDGKIFSKQLWKADLVIK